ncbi:MAG: hypothetical protein JXQ90_02145 [Cyclobacteriaceae bacterium]
MKKMINRYGPWVLLYVLIKWALLLTFGSYLINHDHFDLQWFAVMPIIALIIFGLRKLKKRLAPEQ